MKYRDDKGYTYSTHQGLGDTGWFVMKQKDGCEGWHRVKSPALPERDTETDAQTDLDAWAEKKGLTPIAETMTLEQSVDDAGSLPPVTGTNELRQWRTLDNIEPDDEYAAWHAELIDIRTIRPSPVNRKGLSESDQKVIELAKSIEESELLQPITVRRMSRDEPGFSYELVCGERRWLAYLVNANRRPHIQRLWRIPAFVRMLDERTAHELTALENLQREDLTPYQEAASLAVLLESGKSIEEVADKLGKPAGWVARRAKLRDLSPKWQAAIEKEIPVPKSWAGLNEDGTPKKSAKGAA